jgi:hypothetical protein
MVYGQKLGRVFPSLPKTKGPDTNVAVKRLAWI